MRRSIGLATLLGVLMMPLMASASPSPNTMSFIPGRVLVIAQDDVFAPSGSGVRARSTRLASVLAARGITRIEPIRVAPRADRVEHFYRLESDAPEFDVMATVAALRGTGEFRAVAPDYVIELQGITPDDPYYGTQQWYLEDVQLDEAWSSTTGESTVVIAIMDNGVDAGHPDLASQMWRNPGEIENGIDDDGNGYIDDIHGWDFGSNDDSPFPEHRYDASGVDIGFHGTFCAGIAAAATDNGVGVAGASWQARIMSLKVSHPDSGITLSSITPAFAYAADNGAHILSMSFGAHEDSLGTVGPFFQALVDVATAGNVMCVAGAGNDSTSNPSYPAANDGVLAVGATDDLGNRAYFSQWGSWVDINAPGYLIFSTTCRNYPIDPLDAFIWAIFFGWDSVNPYMYGNGTSFATPMVAGVAAMVLGQNPAMTQAELAQHMIDTGDVETYDHPIGVKLNALAAVGGVSVGVPHLPAGARLGFASIAPNPFTTSAALHFTLPAESDVSLVLYDTMGRRVRTLFEGLLPAGRHASRWDGRDDAGRRLPNGVYMARLVSGAAEARGKVVLLQR